MLLPQDRWLTIVCAVCVLSLSLCLSLSRFIRNYIEDLLRVIRTQVLLKLVRPYTKISIAYLASEHALNVRFYAKRSGFHNEHDDFMLVRLWIRT